MVCHAGCEPAAQGEEVLNSLINRVLPKLDLDGDPTTVPVIVERGLVQRSLHSPADGAKRGECTRNDD